MNWNKHIRDFPTTNIGGVEVPTFRRNVGWRIETRACTGDEHTHKVTATNAVEAINTVLAKYPYALIISVNRA